MSMTNSKKKVLYVITKSNWGGAQRYVCDLATNLSTDIFEAAVATGGTGPLIDKLHVAGIRTILVPSFVRNVSLFHDIRTLRELVTLFHAEAPDIIHLNSAKAVSIGALAGRIAGVPRIVATIHGSASRETWRPWWQQTLIRAIERISRALAHETIVVSAQDAVPGTTLIHNGVDNIDTLSQEKARHELNLPQQGFIVGTIGELTKNKNQLFLIDAVGALPGGNIMLAIIGDGELRTELEMYAHTHPTHDIRFLGYKESAAQYLRAFDVFVLPSRKEGLPYVLLEAGLAALAVIATNVGGISEIIEDGKTGLLIQPGNLSSLTTALTLLMDNTQLRQEYGAALQEKVHSEFSLEKMIADTTARY